MALDGISSFTKPHGTGGNSYSGTTIIINRGTNGKGNFNPNNCNVVNLNAHNASVDNLKVKNTDIDNAVINYFMSPEGNITKITGSELNYQYGHIDDMTANAFSTEKLTVSSDANIKKLMSDYINAHEITTDTLTVTKSAHFFELIIDKIRSVQGTQINTAANCTADFVEAYAGIYHDDRDTKVNPRSHNVDYFRVYFKNADDNGKSIDNNWLTYDQAICQSFNVNEGTSYDVSNKYYWRLVEKTSNDSGAGMRYINFATNEVSNTDPGTFSINFSYGFQYGSSYAYTSYNAYTYTYTYSYNYTNFNVHNQSEGEWDPQTKTFTPSTTIYGLEVTPNPDDDKVLSGGSFIFNTNKKTRLNVGIYYDDGSFDYHPADGYKTDYEIATLENKNAEAFIINTAVIDKWDPCHWIDLSNLSQYIDTDQAKGYAIPSAGDAIAQLGYRYTMRPDYEDTQQWKEDNKDIVARASAIIIAAYSTPDNGDPSNNIPAIYPPSYAQYQDIITFDLSTKRGTYFDATGAYIKGNLVSGTVVEPGVNIPVVIDTWKLLSDFSIITQDSSSQISPSTITLSLLHNNGTSSTIENTLPTDKAIYVNGVLNTGGLSVPVTSFADMTITLADTANTQTFDKIIIEAFDINAANGTNGSYIQFIYKIDDPEYPPTAPTSTAYPPSGWSTTPPTVFEPDVLFMCQRTVTFDANNNPVYPTNPAWTNPFQLSGTNGEPGKDGDEIEYIYYQTEDDTPPMIYRELSDFGEDEQLAVDSGRVHADSQGHIDRWESIEGGEIIYHPPVGTTSDYIPISTYTKEGTPVQIYFSSFWTDEPQGVDETMPYEWVALRKKDGETHQWTDFTEPVIWAHYGQDGAQGAQGPAGQNGQNGQNGKNAFNNVFTYNKADVTVTVSGQTLSSITSGLRTNIINLQMYHIENSTASLVNFIDRGYTLRLDVITFDPSNSQSFIVNSSTTQLWTVTNGTTATINTDNLLSALYPESASYYRDYLKLQESNVAYLPIQLVIYMIDENNVQCTDKLRIDINMQAGYINQMSEAGLYQAFFGSYSYGGQTINGMSSITATMNGISTNVQSLTYSYNTLSSDYSNFKQTSSSFQTTVTSQITDINGDISDINGDINNINGDISDINGDITDINGDISDINGDINTINGNIVTMQSTITQMPDSIKAEVITDIDGQLQSTGIDITQGTITLDADNTIFTGNVNIRAGLFYVSSFVIPSSVCADRNNYHTKTFIIDPERTSPESQGQYYYLPGANTYLLKDVFPPVYATDNFMLRNVITLPNAETYEGLEINVMAALTNDDPYNYWDSESKIANFYGNTSRGIGAYFKTQQNQRIWVPGNNVPNYSSFYINNNVYTIPSVSATNIKLLRTYPQMSHIYPEGDPFLIQPNYFFRLKAIAGIWYVIDGLISPY